MNRLAGIIIVILGLIVQPLMAAMPVEIADQNTNTTAALTIDMAAHVDELKHHDTHNSNKMTSAPCHGNAVDHGSFPGTCDYCDTTCINSGICASSCVAGGAAASGEMMVLPEQHVTSPTFGNAEHLGSGFLSRIYHPPKLS